MTTCTGWLCPSCGKAHAPHVETCPSETRVDIVNANPAEITVTSSERKTDFGRVIDVHVAKSITSGRFDKAVGARYGARNVIHAR